MLVAEWMTRDPVTIGVDATLGAAAALMVKHRIRRLPVRASDGRLVGILSKGDVLGGAPAGLNPFSPTSVDDERLAVPLRQAMTATPVSVPSDAPLEAAAQLMIDHKIGGLPVTAGAALVGILTESDLFRAFTAAFSGRGPGLRITFEITAGEDLLALVVNLAKRYRQRVGSFANFRIEGKELAVIRLEGPASDLLIDELWKTGHRVQSVLRVGEPPKSS